MMTRFIRGIRTLAGYAVLAAAAGGCAWMAAAQNLPKDTLQDLGAPPAQPGDEAWTFIDDLKAPLWGNGLGWGPRPVADGEADLSRGARVNAAFPDAEGVLKTAYADLADFCAAGKLAADGPYVIETAKAQTPVFEAYRIEVAADRCRILAADTEGIRRGIFKVEDMMREAGGPFLKLGTIERKPFIKSRVSRCFFGPIKRPPRYRDELMDDVDYYPDQYLNRLAHEGINGLWLTITFKDLCKTEVAPEYGGQAERRLAKLRKTVAQCRRYGIRIYIFSIEPTAWVADSPVLKRHPELGSVRIGKSRPFCPWSDVAQRYLYESTRYIFAQVPNLGGLINISHGEGLTTCQSIVTETSNRRSPCPVCSKKEPWEIINATLAPMAKGMHDANPDADFIAWFYMPQDDPLGDWVYELPKHCPEHVTMQFNFESGVTKHVFGRGRRGADYWISTPGPSRRYERLASFAKQAGTPMSAKIQTGCSHEVATIPFVPAPGMLYRKFRAMRELDVSSVMLCWYFGNYPGIMNRAAGELSFEPFPDTEETFMRRLVGPEWSRHAETAARALTLFTEGYSHYPLVTEFQYFGPMHDGVVWPLLLRPRDVWLAPTWRIAWHAGKHIGIPFAPSGDRIGEALGQVYTLSEAIEECRAMSGLWDQGVALLRTVEADPGLLPERRLDIGVARALGIQFRSGLNILRFYDLRERMVNEKPEKQRVILGEMRRIVEEEHKSGAELIGLCGRDSRLGFHSEAEGYKYFPAKIRWRMNQLQNVLEKEFPALERDIASGKDVFAAYSGRAPADASLRSLYRGEIGNRTKELSGLFPKDVVWQKCEKPTARATGAKNFRWTVCHDRDAFYVVYDGAQKSDRITLTLEPRRLWTCLNYSMSASGEKQPRNSLEFDAHAREGVNGWQGWMRLPFVSLRMDAAAPAPLRINVRHVSGGGERAWIARNPWPYRLRLCSENPEDLGWLFFE
ncbi:MAG: hypothetical protein PHG96_09545 [Kiritimatiellae bacterium]|nr:hypothetical protein [Kiritimatiellia bacterium]MDD3545583.1 hypothetical protein [Kiritimatiellia bacterium]MDD4024359.1 hypothetical protein [Kiritimatiellia bacterium]